jgi:OOP family OmpA-OmpF porin
VAAARGDERLDELRKLLLRPEQDQLVALLRRLDDPLLRAQDVSGVLAEAIVLRAQLDEELNSVLAPMIVEGLKRAVRAEPGIVVDVVAPIIGPAIRAAVRDAIHELVASVERLRVRMFTLQALRWRREAWRTHRPFSEVILDHSLVFRVEQLLLIHRDTGLLVQHVAHPATQPQDPALVSSMLTAIQEFAWDSLGESDDTTLRGVTMGTLELLVFQARRAVLAAVVRGVLPAEVHASLAEVLETISRLHAEPLEHFGGDVRAFAPARLLLEDCLVSRSAA